MGQQSANEVHCLHRKGALTIRALAFSFRNVDDRKDWLK
jgi:hypothetical protein